MVHSRHAAQSSGRQLMPRHRPGRRLHWRPAFPLARPRPAGSEILPLQFSLLFTDIENRPADPTCPSAHRNLRSFQGDAFSPGPGLAPRQAVRTKQQAKCPHPHRAATVQERPRPRPPQDPAWARGEGCPTASASREGPHTEAHRQSRGHSLAPQMGSVCHSSDSLKLLSQELREVKSALTGSRVLNPQ